VCAPCVWPCPGLRPPERGTAPELIAIAISSGRARIPFEE